MTTGTRNGSFVFYEQTSDLVLGSAKLITPRLGKTGAHCVFSFWYYKEDHHDDESVFFSLSMVIGRQRTVERLWYTQESAANKSWRQIHVGLHSKAAGSQLFFQATHLRTDSTRRTQLAVDDTAYLYCGFKHDVPCSGNSVFKCANELCVPNYKVDARSFFTRSSAFLEDANK
jgi:hypothetical protein